MLPFQKEKEKLKLSCAKQGFQVNAIMVV